jgi:hypothetical protein
MRIDSQPSPIIATPERHEVKGVTSVHVVKPVSVDGREVPDVIYHRETERQAPKYEGAEKRGHGEERRKLTRRVSKQAVLIELRSGVDRRRVDQRDGDVRIHIDELA